MRRAPRPGRSGRLPLAALAVLLATTAGCEDQIKWIPWFSTMTSQPSREAYEVPPIPPPEGAVPVHGEPSYDLLTADTALSNPLEASDEVLDRGQALFTIFCTPCHGEAGAGGGPVVGPNRIPPTPLLNLLSDRAVALSDGHIWGMITHGRGLMPSYRRIPPRERWTVVSYVRQLQAAAGAGTPGGGGGPGGAGDAGGTGADTVAAATGGR